MRYIVLAVWTRLAFRVRKVLYVTKLGAWPCLVVNARMAFMVAGLLL